MRAKKRLIALLNEQKQTIIHRAVTRGLDPTVPLKPSGIPWLSDIPKHWEILGCGSFFPKLLTLGIRPRGYGRLTVSKESCFSLTPGEVLALLKTEFLKRVRPGQLAYNLMNTFMGALGFSTLGGIVSPAYAVAPPRRIIEPLYFHHLLRTTTYTGGFDRQSYGIMYERKSPLL